MQIPRMLAAFVLALWPAASAYCQEITEPKLTGEDWIDTFHCKPLESLYHTEEDFPESLNKLILAGPKSFSAIRKGLRCTDLKVRFTCLVALNNMGLSRDSIEIVGPWMEKALQDESPWVRTEAAWGLGKLPWPKAKDTLLRTRAGQQTFAHLNRRYPCRTEAHEQPSVQQLLEVLTQFVRKLTAVLRRGVAGSH